MAALATVDDLENRLPANSGDVDVSRASAALDDASAVVRTEAGEDWTDDDGEPETVPAVVVAVTCASAIRAYLWAGPKTQETVGGWSASYSTRDDALALTASEKRLIRRAIGGSTGLGSVTLTSPYTMDDTEYLDVEGSPNHIPVWEGTGY